MTTKLFPGEVAEWTVGLRVAMPLTLAEFRIGGFDVGGREIVAIIIPQAEGKNIMLEAGCNYLLTLKLEAGHEHGKEKP